ncbi:hypothetical protein GGR51DRAFT_566687 [Nemania sp. FL0031]|nr:hypothetical protein GGR51DRAFT_566687 [Nemania sp. FL0031]
MASQGRPLRTVSTAEANARYAPRHVPFQGVAPLRWEPSAIRAHQKLTVVGYPTDLDRGGEPAGEMYEMAIDREINLERTKLNILSYQGYLQGGFSSSPVIRNSDGAVIGVHIEGGSFNIAVVIGGLYGVRFLVYDEAMQIIGMKDGYDSSIEIKSGTSKKWLKYMDLPCTA